MKPEHETIRLRLSYPLAQAEAPILYRLVHDYGLIPNIRRANIHPETGGTIFLELSGEHEALQQGLDFLDRRGITVTGIGLEGAEGWPV